MEAIQHALHALTPHLCGCLHTAGIHLCPDKAEQGASARRPTTEQCLDGGFLPGRSHPHHHGLCLHPPWDDGHKITGTVFPRYGVETKPISSGHVLPMDVSLHRTITETPERFITDILFDPGLLNRTIDPAQP